ncbi:TetR/AcrR family transcriptional regulator [Patulibacter sp. NPDC049589]|uniref:TetR/AcrR family transcriptional regulator n=1 Tax=Patulibacter sp. NPDC049589 TaxID=3154731 RepID=UPI003414C19F
MPHDHDDPKGSAPGARGRLTGGRHGLSEAEVAASQRSRILEGMRVALEEDGYAGASLTRITALAGVSRKTLYVHFEDKEECFLTVYRSVRERLYSPALRAYARPGTWPVRIVAALSALLESLAADPGGARICLVEVYAAGARARALRNDNLVELHDLYEPGTEERATLGLPSADPVPAGPAGPVVLGGISEMIFREVAEGRAARLPHLLPDIAYVALSPHIGPTRALREVEALTGRAL